MTGMTTGKAFYAHSAHRAAVKFNQMSGEKVQMSGEAKKDFAYTDAHITYSIGGDGAAAGASGGAGGAWLIHRAAAAYTVCVPIKRISTCTPEISQIILIFNY